MTPLFGIFGTGRSGSTWLGSIVDSHPEVAYRFEPFHREGPHSRLGDLRRVAEAGDATQATLDQLYDALLPADPKTTRAPFYPKTNRRNLLIDKAWAASRKSKLAVPIYRSLYTPRSGGPLVFKEVTLERLMERLVVDTGLRSVYLVRHPCAVVSSLLRGQARGLMPSGRRQFLEERLRRDDPATWERLRGDTESLSGAQQEALLWRLDVADGFRMAMEDPRTLLVVYEDLCRRPEEVASSVFAHFDLEMTEQSKRAIEDTTRAGDSERKDRWADRYFTVFRDPLAASERWRSELPAEDQRAIMDLVEDAPAVRYASDRGLWV